MIRRHVALLRELCHPRAFLLMETRPNGQRRAVLIKDFRRYEKMVVNVTTIQRWINWNYLTSSCHTSKSYIITETGRQFVRLHDDGIDLPPTIDQLRAVQRAAHEALGRAR